MSSDCSMVKAAYHLQVDWIGVRDSINADIGSHDFRG